MQEWWNARAPRERIILSLSAIVFLGMLYFLVVWEPLVKGVATLEARRSDSQALQMWLRTIEPEVSLIRRSAVPGKASNQGSVLSLTDSTAKAAGLRPSITRMQPEGDNTVRVWLDSVSFNPLLAWLQKMDERQAIRITDINITRDTKPGHVKARLTLKR